MAGLYAEASRFVPHCFPATDDEFGAALAGEGGHESDGRRLREQTVMVAVESGRGVGFVHVGVEESEKDQTLRGIVRFLWYPRGRRDLGQSLLDAAERWLRRHGVRTVSVYPETHRYRFYAFAHMYLSDRLDHIQALFLFYTNYGFRVADWTYGLGRDLGE